VERSDQVLAGRQIRSGLAAHARVHLRQQSRRDGEERDTAHEDRREETGQVGDDAAAEADHDARAVAALVEHLLRQHLDARQTLIGLTTGKKQSLERMFSHPRGECATMQLPDIGCGDDEYPARSRRDELRQARQCAIFHDGVIAAGRRGDGKGRHASF